MRFICVQADLAKTIPLNQCACKQAQIQHTVRGDAQSCECKGRMHHKSWFISREIKVSHLEKQLHAKGKPYVENSERHFQKRLPKQYFAQCIINHAALKNMLDGGARRCERSGPRWLADRHGPGWKSHITTGAAGAGWTGRKDVGQQNGSIREGQRQRGERMFWSVWVETLQRKCLMTILRLCLSGKTTCFFWCTLNIETSGWKWWSS